MEGFSPVLREWDVCRQTLHLPAWCGARDQGLGPGAARHVRGTEEETRHIFFRILFIHLVNPQRCFTCIAFMNPIFPCVADAHKLES